MATQASPELQVSLRRGNASAPQVMMHQSHRNKTLYYSPSTTSDEEVFKERPGSSAVDPNFWKGDGADQQTVDGTYHRDLALLSSGIENLTEAMEERFEAKMKKYFLEIDEVQTRRINRAENRMEQLETMVKTAMRLFESMQKNVTTIIKKLESHSNYISRLDPYVQELRTSVRNVQHRLRELEQLSLDSSSDEEDHKQKRNKGVYKATTNEDDYV